MFLKMMCIFVMFRYRMRGLLFLFFKLRDRIDNIVFGLYLLSLFRIGKYILNDSNIYVKSLENLFVKFSFFF